MLPLPAGGGSLSLKKRKVMRRQTGRARNTLAPLIVSLLTPDRAVQQLGVRVLRIEVFAEPLYAVSIAAAGAMRGGGRRHPDPQFGQHVGRAHFCRRPSRAPPGAGRRLAGHVSGTMCARSAVFGAPVKRAVAGARSVGKLARKSPLPESNQKMPIAHSSGYIISILHLLSSALECRRPKGRLLFYESNIIWSKRKRGRKA